MSNFPQYPEKPESQPEEPEKAASRPDTEPVTESTDPVAEPVTEPVAEPVAEQVPPTKPAGWRHPVDVGHLVMGVAFLLLAGVWLLVASDAVEGRDVRWLLPVPWIAAGVAGIVASVAKARASQSAR